MRHTPTLRLPNVQFPARTLSVPALPPMALAALAVSALDLLSCSAYWALQGVPLARVMRGPAAWIVGADIARKLRERPAPQFSQHQALSSQSD